MKKRITPTKWVANNYDCVMPFGKYKGYKIRYIVDNEPSYILWLSDNDIVKFSNKILNEAERYDERGDDYYSDEDRYWPLDD